MIKNGFVILTLICLHSINLHAQMPKKDSLQLANTATADANNFKLNKKDLKAFREHREDYKSQYLNAPGHNPLAFPPTPFIKLSVLPPAEIKRRRLAYNKVDYYANYFKPSKATTADTTLLTDSVYVSTFRDVAYKNTVDRKPARFYLGIGAAVAGGIAVIVVLYGLFSTAG